MADVDPELQEAAEACPCEPDPHVCPQKQDALSLEFIYYGAALKVIAPNLSNDSDRKKVNPWIKKLFQPEYQATKLKEKRNRYLVSLTVNLLNDEAVGVFEHPPPLDKLPDLDTIPIERGAAAAWELDKMWQETLVFLPDDFEMMKCPIHDEVDECKADTKLNKVLDNEFQFLLFLTRPYAALLPPEDKVRTAAWLQTLCSIHGEACSSMRAIRNDYITSLLGYLHDLRIVGPFVDYPPAKLIPLKDAAKLAAQTCPPINPTGPEADQFLAEQPVPEDGAFCYIALTGDLVATSL